MYFWVLTSIAIQKHRCGQLQDRGYIRRIDGLRVHTLTTAWELFDRGIELVEHFERTGNLPDILEAILIQQRAVQLTPNDHPDMPAILNNLGIAFQSRFECIGDVSDLTEAISIKQRAVQLTPSTHPDMPMRLNNLGMSFENRFEHTGDISDLAEAKQWAVQLTPSDHPNMPICLSNLGISFQSRLDVQAMSLTWWRPFQCCSR